MNVGDLREREFKRSKTAWFWYLAVQGMLVLVSAANVWVRHDVVSMVLGVASLALPFVSFAVRGSAQTSYARGERARRMELVEDGLGRTPSALELARLANDAGVALKAGTPRPSPYASVTVTSAQRLSENLEEAAFFTADLARKVSRSCGGIMIAALSFSMLLLVVALRSKDGAVEIRGLFVGLARAISIAAVFFGAGEFASLYRSFRRLARTAHKVTTECSHLRRQTEITDVDVLLLMDEYDCALASAAPIPGFIHIRHQSRLNANWAAYVKETRPPSGAAPAKVGQAVDAIRPSE